MEYKQTKLTKDEWEFLEKPIPLNEKEILSLLKKGKADINISFNKSMTLGAYMKLENNADFHNYLYEMYFKKKIFKINEKYKIKYKEPKRKKIKLKSRDLIRIKNSTKKLNSSIDLYEFLLLDNVEKFLKNNYNLKYYYTLTQLLKNNIYNINNVVLCYVKYILDFYKSQS